MLPSDTANAAEDNLSKQGLPNLKVVVSSYSFFTSNVSLF